MGQGLGTRGRVSVVYADLYGYVDPCTEHRRWAKRGLK
jgi:hypothetical protein